MRQGYQPADGDEKPSIPTTGDAVGSRKRQEGTEEAMLKAIRAWLQCPRDYRPTSRGLGQRITEIADIYNLLDVKGGPV